MSKPFCHHPALKSHPNMTKSDPDRNTYCYRFVSKSEAIELIRSFAVHYGSSIKEGYSNASTVIYLPVKGALSARMRRSKSTHALYVVALSQGCDRATLTDRWDVTIKSHACHNGRLESEYTICRYWE